MLSTKKNYRSYCHAQYTLSPYFFFACDLRHEPSPVHLQSFIMHIFSMHNLSFNWCKMIVDEPFTSV
jgi:hypothetical protein